ncbi:unnamed protein product [Adineta steineri]|uniref:Uncharacterized protein n=1 Tax=Adineta steineri TaxID=433720 RepID=A0A814AL17_9BILA|nr:unnamed protein product [Adineta steineri]
MSSQSLEEYRLDRGWIDSNYYITFNPNFDNLFGDKLLIGYLVRETPIDYITLTCYDSNDNIVIDFNGQPLIFTSSSHKFGHLIESLPRETNYYYIKLIFNLQSNSGFDPDKVFFHCSQSTSSTSIATPIATSTTDSAPESKVHSATEPTTDSTPESTADSTMESTTHSTSGSTTDSTPESTAHSTIESTTDSTSESTTDSTSDSTAHSTPDSTKDSTPESTVHSTIESTADSTMESTTDSTPESTTHSTIESTAYSTAESTIDSTMESTAQSTIESTTNSTPESTTDSTIELATHSTIESTAHSTSESTTDSTIESTADSTPDSTAHSTPESTTHSSTLTTTSCFFGGDQVRLVNGDITTISELRSGMIVYSMNNHNEIVEDEVIMMLRRDPDETDLFCVIETDDRRYKLSVTCDHYVAVSDGSKTQYLISDHIKPTEHLVYVQNDLNHELEPVQVTNVTRQYKTGLYALATNEGTLIINNIVASCYTNITTIGIAHNVLGLFRAYYRVAKWFSVEEPFKMQTNGIPKSIQFIKDNLTGVIFCHDLIVNTVLLVELEMLITISFLIRIIVQKNIKTIGSTK